MAVFVQGCSNINIFSHSSAILQKDTFYFLPHCTGHTTFQMHIFLPVVCTSPPSLKHHGVRVHPRAGDPRTLISSPSLHRTREAAEDRVCVTKLPLPSYCWCVVISTCFGLLHNGRFCSHSSFISYLTGKTMELHQLEKQDPEAGEVVERDKGPRETSVPMSPTGPHVSLQRGSSAPAAHTGVSGSGASLPAPSTIFRRWICGLLLITAI